MQKRNRRRKQALKNKARIVWGLLLLLLFLFWVVFLGIPIIRLVQPEGTDKD